MDHENINYIDVVAQPPPPVFNKLPTLALEILQSWKHRRSSIIFYCDHKTTISSDRRNFRFRIAWKSFRNISLVLHAYRSSQWCGPYSLCIAVFCNFERMHEWKNEWMNDRLEYIIMKKLIAQFYFMSHTSVTHAFIHIVLIAFVNVADDSRKLIFIKSFESGQREKWLQ